MKKRILSLLIAAAMLLSLFGTATTAETTEKLFYTITFDTNGGDTPSWQDTVGEDTHFIFACYNFPTPVRFGYIFNGWYTDLSFSTEVGMTGVDSDMTLYARWFVCPNTAPLYDLVDGAPFTITLDPQYDGAEEFKTVLTREDGTLLLSDLPQLRRPNSGYILDRWVDADGNTVLPASVEQLGTVFTEDTTIYSVWKITPLFPVTIRFDPNGGSISVGEVVIWIDQLGSPAPLHELPIPTRPGYVFAGWTQVARGGGYITTETDFSMYANSGRTIFAQWYIDFSLQHNYTVTTILEPSLRFDELHAFRFGFAWFRVFGSGWGLVSATGEIIAPAQYGSVGDFTSGLAVVSNLEECGTRSKSGIINTKGEVILPIMYDGIKAVGEGFAAVLANNKWGFIDMNGNAITEPIFDDVRSFKNGFAGVRIDGTASGNRLPETWGFINTKGELVIPPGYSEVRDFDAHGLALVATGTDFEGFPVGFPQPIGASWGFINTAGEVVIPLIYNRADGFSEGLAAVALNDDDGRRFWGYINTAGEIIIEPQYGIARPFESGFAAVGNPRGGSSGSGFINKNGEVIIPLRYSMVDSFTDGLVTVRNWILSNPMGQVYFTYNTKGELVSQETRTGRDMNQWDVGNGLIMREHGVVSDKGAAIIPSVYDTVRFAGTVDNTSYFWVAQELYTNPVWGIVAVTNNREAAADVRLGHVLDKDYICVLDALEILKYIVGIETVIEDGNRAFNAARITGGDTPTVSDALEILKYLVQLPSRVG